MLSNKHVALFRGNANNTLNDSTFYWNLNNTSSNLNRNIGTRLAGASLKGKLSHQSCVHTQKSCSIKLSSVKANSLEPTSNENLQ